MDERLVNLYETELRHLREMTGEFAREYPKIAGRLALDRDAKETCPDPYVERLIEGFAWLAARVHLKLDAEFPRFTQALLETVYPHYLSPVPSMAIVRFEIDPQQPALAAGVVVPRGTALKSNLGKRDRTPCVFQTAHPVKLLPLRVMEARYFTRDLQELNLPSELGTRAALRIRLQTTGGQPLEKIALDEIAFYTRGTDDLPGGFICEQIFARKLGLIVQSPTERGRQLARLPGPHVQQMGFSPEESLLPPSPRGFEGYRLLREYFALPQRFLFFKLAGLAEAAGQCKGDQLDLIIPLKEQDTSLERRVDASCFELFCAPAINLFSKTLDRISLSEGFYEFHVVPDRNRTTDFEVFELESVTGYSADQGQELELRPFYLAKDTDTGAGAYFTTNRVPRMLTANERRVSRSSYTGSEVFLSLVDANSAPYRANLRDLGLKALCTNRHLPIQMAVGIGRTDFSMGLNAPVSAIRCITGPTPPRPSHAEGRFFWRLISHLSLNYLSLVDSAKGDEGAAGLRELLKLYTDEHDSLALRQIEGLLTVRSKPIVRRVAAPGPISFARGLEIAITFDETAFAGQGVFILGAVLEQFFAKYVSLNSFTETVICTKQRGEIIRWPTRMGIRQIL